MLYKNQKNCLIKIFTAFIDNFLLAKVKVKCVNALAEYLFFLFMIVTLRKKFYVETVIVLYTYSVAILFLLNKN